MKIIRLTTFLDYGGIERKMENISSWHDGNEWIFVAINKGGTAEKVIQKNRKKVRCLNLGYRIPNITTILKLYKMFRKEKPDVVHAAGAEANFHGIIAAKMARVPVKIAEEIGITQQKKIAIWVFKLIYGIADFVVGESQVVVDDLAKRYKIRKNKLKKVYNFIDVKKYTEDQIEYKPRKDQIFKIITVSRLEEKKNIEMAIYALKKNLEAGFSFQYIIVGSGSLDKKLKKLVKKLELKDNVQFLGFQSNPRDYLLNADLFLTTSTNEGFSNALLEAMLAKLPSLSTKVGGAEDIIVDDQNGWLIDVNDLEGLIAKLKHILQMPDSNLKSVSDFAYKTVIENFTLEEHMKTNYELYNLS